MNRLEKRKLPLWVKERIKKFNDIKLNKGEKEAIDDKRADYDDILLHKFIFVKNLKLYPRPDLWGSIQREDDEIPMLYIKFETFDDFENEFMRNLCFLLKCNYEMLPNLKNINNMLGLVYMDKVHKVEKKVFRLDKKYR